MNVFGRLTKEKWRNRAQLVPGAGEVAKLFFIKKTKVEIPASEGAVRDLSVTS